MTKKTPWKKYIGLAGILFLFPLIWLIFFGIMGKHNFKTLQYYGPEAPQGTEKSEYVIPDFIFENEHGEIVTRDSMLGKVWLAAFYDLSDPMISKITERLLNVNFKYRNEPDIRIMVFSTNCDHDRGKLSLDYVESNTRYNSYPGKWQILTGDQAAMQAFIRNAFLINDLNTEARFRLVDADGHIRGLYGNTEYHFIGGTDSIPGVIQDIALLKKEFDLRKYHEKKSGGKLQ